MPNIQKQTLSRLKDLRLGRTTASIAIVKEYKRDRVSNYDIKYVRTDENLEERLKRIIINHVRNANSVEKYTYDCPEPEADLVRGIDYSETDFYEIVEQLQNLNPEEDVIDDIDELVRAKAYMIILRNAAGIQVVGFKTLPENWKMRKTKGLIPLLFRENRFEDLEDDKVFSIAGVVDLIYFDETLFILSKKEFERGLNFREGMLTKVNEMYEEVEGLNVFIGMDILKGKVGDNQRYLRKITIVKNLGHYRNPGFLQKMQELNIAKGWNIEFRDGKIVFTEETLEAILTLLQNKRLHSELTDEDFDVESAKPL